MVIIMNKEEFIENLSEQTELTKEESLIVNNILENNFFISKRYKDKIISEIVISLNTNFDKATKIYNVAIEIISRELKNKLKHPFKKR